MKTANKKTAIIGGDRRQQALAEFLAECGARVDTYGFAMKPDSGVTVCDNLEDALLGADFVLLPLPAFSSDGLLATNGERRITIYEIITASERDCLLLGGMLKDDAKKLLEKQGRAYVDYYESDELQSLNAIPTAEGALAIAMQMRTRTIAGSTALVIGYGRIGKVLARYLQALGAFVTVAARNPIAREQAAMCGLKVVDITEMDESLAKSEMIFNTVPARVIEDKKLDFIGQKVPLIELASAPYGFSFSAAAEKGVSAILASSLPGKVAPDTAGEAIGKVVLSILAKRGVL